MPISEIETGVESRDFRVALQRVKFPSDADSDNARTARPERGAS